MLPDVWRVQLLGGLSATLGSLQIQRFRSQKYGLLLAYLAYFGQRAHTREELIALLWPEAETEAGRLNLRVALSSLRKQLEPPGVPRGSVLAAEGDAVQLRPEAFETDVQLFERELRAAELTGDTQVRRDHLIAAAGAYSGRLLPAFYEDWVSVEQVRLEERHRQALHLLIDTLQQTGEAAQALDYAHQAVGIDPLDEGANQMLIRLYLTTGQPASALRQYQEFALRLEQQIGARPSAATRLLLEGGQHAGEGVGREVTGGSDTKRMLPASPKSVKPAPAFCWLPPTMNRFLGRESELAALEERLGDAGNRLLTIAGTAGVGKTRFAIEAARRFADRLSAAVGFVSLSGTTDPQRIPETMQSALHLTPSASTPPLDQVIDYLCRAQGGADTRILLVLDNLEHLLGEAAEVTLKIVRTLMTKVPGLTLLVTSRQALLLEGELRFPLTTLPMPQLPGTPERLTEFAGIQLFIERAQAVRPDFQLTPRNVAAVTELCRRLDGLPLALELAAAWAQILTPVQMLERLTNRFQMLVNRRRDQSSHHRSLHAAINASFSLLPPPAQRLFLQLSVFRGSFTLEAAREVCEPMEMEETEGASFEDLFARLQEHSLIGIEMQEEELRFSLLESLREFAWEQLTPQEAYALSLAHAHWCFRRVSGAGEDGYNARWVPILAREQENWRAALAFCFHTLPQALPEGKEPPGALGTQLVIRLNWYWGVCGAFEEAQSWLERALLFAQNESDAGTVVQIRCFLANKAFFQGQDALAESYCLACLEQWQEIFPVSLKADVLNQLGQIYTRKNEYERAEKMLTEALEIFKALGQANRVGLVLNALGVVARHRGDLTQARFYGEEALRYAREAQDVVSIARALNILGTIAGRQKDDVAAIAYYQESIAYKRISGDRLGLANSLSNLASIIVAVDPSLAFRYVHESLTLRHEMEDRRGILISLICLGDMMIDRDPLQAVRFYAMAQTVIDANGLVIPPAVREQIDLYLERVRRQEPTMETVWNMARLLTPEAAVEQALRFCTDSVEAALQREGSHAAG